MDGQWGWIGGSVFATATGWFGKEHYGDQGYWCHHDVGVPQIGAYGLVEHGGIGWGSPVHIEEQEQCFWDKDGSNWAVMLAHGSGKCGWSEAAAPDRVPVMTMTHAFPSLQLAPESRSFGSSGWKSDGMTATAAASSATATSATASPSSDDEFSSLPDDLLEKIFAALPLLSLFRARAVCKRWHGITTSKSFMALCAQVTTHKPWYLMYKDSEKMVGVAFDPTSRKWHNFVLPPLDDPSASFVASAGGLACFLDKTNSEVAYVCNPMTKAWRQLPRPPERLSSDYCAVAMCVQGEDYKIVVARSTPVTNDYAQWSLSIEVYDSGLAAWRSPRFKLLQGWRPGEESNICNGVFYCVTHSTVGAGHDYSRHGLIAYDISHGAFQDLILPMPCSLSCVRLVNCWERLVMVGGIGTYDFIKGVGVWELQGEWKQISRMPTKQFHGFAGGLDDVFSCSGHGDLIYIHSYGSPQLMVFDIPQGSWTWARACPVLKRDPLHLFTGFCFQPRLDVSV
ncbi:F-box/kelch-repeat protein At3g61590 [Selaginella moellendorffii]|uniref:F-box/kelch-repeat protein At3g61590 n=1 Tax=Selaginella moellendorffii TaxID=88036 RepID=UPI000D1C4472|nr:F-box/kelch-repeat protein At3g61590 [Selaginella moellendorffii]|eukprot:XP_002986312.2 F-box/kelch-repeat protein At3g61590 [Selaginella moellendorffii]